MSYGHDLGPGDLDADGPQDPLDAYLEDHFQGMLGDAIDSASDLRVDIDQKGAFWRYLRDSRREASQSLAAIVSVDAGDVAAIRGIQISVMAYMSALGFAKKLVNGIVPPEIDSAGAPVEGVGEPQNGEAGEPG